MSFKREQSGGSHEGPVTRTRQKQALSNKPLGRVESSNLIRSDNNAFKYKPYAVIQAACLPDCGYDDQDFVTSVKCSDRSFHSDLCLTSHEKFKGLQSNYSYNDHDEHLGNKPNGNIFNIKRNSSRNNEDLSLLSLESKMKTTKIATSVSNGFAKFSLIANLIFMLTYFNLLKHSDHKKHFEIYGTAQLFSSVEQGLTLKIIWCIIFGLITDIVSWKTAFRIQAVLWISCLITKLCIVSSFINWLLSAVCFSSSALLISLIGICKICERAQSWSLFCHLYFLSSSILLCIQLCGNQFESLQRTAVNCIEPYVPETIFHKAFPMLVKSLPLVIICGCAVNLVIIPLLSYDRVISSTRTCESNNNHDDKDLPNTSKLNCLLKILTLEIIIFMPASCFMVSFKSDVAQELPLQLPICLILWSVFPILQRFICLRRLFLYLISLLFLSLIMTYIRRYVECMKLLSIVIPSLLLIISPLFNYNVLEELKKNKMDEKLTGLTFACLLSIHLIIKYVSSRLFL